MKEITGDIWDYHKQGHWIVITTNGTVKSNGEAVMGRGIALQARAKFIQHPDLREKLLSTGDAILHEDSPWDKYWGYAKGGGLDRLGKLLMQVREELRHGN